jgi:hypothetical protein
LLEDLHEYPPRALDKQMDKQTNKGRTMKINRSQAVLKAGIVTMMALTFALIPTAARAQSSTTGAIAGVVKDASGGVLPGATVEAQSPALIEGVRSVVTDAHGEYKIVDLRPGTYSVSFSAPGFETVAHTGLELHTGITLPVDAQMQVGSVTQTVTVTGATPVVDVENSSPQNLLTTETLTSVPQAGGIPAYAAITVGASTSGAPDVGGNQGEEDNSILIHDSRTNDDDELLDGMSWSSGQSTGGLGQRSVVINKVSVQEITVSVGTAGAEAGHPGANVNIVPKEGSNQLHGAFNGTQTTRSFESTNLDSALVARGLAAGENIKETYDYGIGVGGPILHDRIWIWGGWGQWNSEQYAAGNYFNATQSTLFYTPDLKRQAYTENFNHAFDIRLTYQLSHKNKIDLYQGFQNFCICFQNVDTGNIAPEAASDVWNRASFLTQGAWTGTLTSKLLVRAGITSALAPGRVDGYSPGVNKTDVPIVLENTGYGYHAYLGQSSISYGRPLYDEINGMTTVAYITGSHALKAGFTWQWNNENYNEDLNSVPDIGPVSYEFNQAAGAPQPIPVQITEYASPLKFNARTWVDAIYVQDQWTLKRLTLNLGLRYDWERGYSPAQTVAAAAFTPAHNFPAVKGIPDWNDIEPRLGASYNLFGNGKSAIKGSIGRFVLGDYSTTAIANVPANAIVTSTTRTWDNTSGTYVPGCDLTNPAANGECGPISNSLFGGISTNTTYDPKLLSGWNVRPSNWQADVQFQQQLLPGVVATAGYYRTWYGNFEATENTAVPATGYGTFCITGPVDSRVSSLKGSTVCGFHDVDPAYYGKVNNLVTHSKNFGSQSEVYNGIDLNVYAPFGHKGGFIAGGFALGQVSYNDCAIATKYPNVTVVQTNAIGSITTQTTTPTQFCHYVIPWGSGGQVKFNGSYPLPTKWGGGVVTSVLYQNMPGYLYNTNYVASNAQIASSLGRNISACGTANPCKATETLTDALYTPFSQSESRLNQLDLRFSRLFKIKERLQIKANLDIYNISNSNTILTEATTYSATNGYLKPTSILGPRMFKLGTNVTF